MVLQVRADELRYAVIEESNNVIRCRSRFFDIDEADWYGRNMWKAARLKELKTVFRVIDLKKREELTIFGAIDSLTLMEVNLACTMARA